MQKPISSTEKMMPFFMLPASLFAEHFYVRQSPYARGNKAILCVLQLWLTCSSIQWRCGWARASNGSGAADWHKAKRKRTKTKETNCERKYDLPRYLTFCLVIFSLPRRLAKNRKPVCCRPPRYSPWCHFPNRSSYYRTSHIFPFLHFHLGIWRAVHWGFMTCINFVALPWHFQIHLFEPV